MSAKYNVNWDSDTTKGNVIKSGKTMVITTKPITPMFAAVILKNYKKEGRKWKGTPVLISQERFLAADGKLEIKLKRKYRGEIKNLAKGKYMLKTWIAHPKTFIQTMYHDQFEIV